ncbi:MAG: hypothetical protein ACT4QF_07740 [Sporichthyaceae bacterium]
MVDPPPIPPHVVTFLRDHVTSLLQLEVLLLVAEADEPRTAAELAAQMYLSEAVVADWLDAFAAKGFCRSEEAGYRGLKIPAVAELLIDVADTYVRRKVTVGRLIHGAPPTDPRISLAEAFRLRRDDRNGP